MSGVFSRDGAAQDLEALRPYLMRYARSKLGDPHAAEDVVQETLLAALAGRQAFEGRSALRTWLTSILRHKIVDVYRRQAGEHRARPRRQENDAATDMDEQAFHDADSAHDGHAGDDPAEVFERREVSRRVLHAVSTLPPRQRDAFVLVHMHGVSGSEAAARVGVSACNLWIILHRSRKALQLQLQGLRAA